MDFCVRKYWNFEPGRVRISSQKTCSKITIFPIISSYVHHTISFACLFTPSRCPPQHFALSGCLLVPLGPSTGIDIVSKQGNLGNGVESIIQVNQRLPLLRIEQGETQMVLPCEGSSNRLLPTNGEPIGLKVINRVSELSVL